MKKTISFLVALLLLLGLTGCTEEPPATTDPTQPPYKTVYVHSSITQEFGSSISRTEYVFDEQDRVTEVIVYTNDTETKRHRVDSDENGNFIRWTSDSSVMEYTYDEQGHNLQSQVYIDGNLISSTEYLWDNGLLASVTTKMAAQNMTQKVVNTYDSTGRILRQDSYTADTLSSYSICTYDHSGRPQSTTTYLPDGTLFTTSSHTWEGNTQTITTADAAGAVKQIAVRIYDEYNNLLTHALYNADNTLISKETHTWKAINVAPDCPRASV